VLYSLQNLHFSVCTLGIDIVPECTKYFLESIMSMSYLILDFPNVTVGSTAYQLANFVFIGDVGIDFFRHLKYKNH